MNILGLWFGEPSKEGSAEGSKALGGSRVFRSLPLWGSGIFKRVLNEILISGVFKPKGLRRVK